MKSFMADFEETYSNALPCDRYGIVKLSPRKNAVIKREDARGMMDNNRFRRPDTYVIVSTHGKYWEAQDHIRQLVLMDIAQAIQEKGKAYLINLTDGQLRHLPQGALTKEMYEYIEARLNQS